MPYFVPFKTYLSKYVEEDENPPDAVTKDEVLSYLTSRRAFTRKN